jgi:hypothetical protein
MPTARYLYWHSSSSEYFIFCSICSVLFLWV